MKNFLTTLFLLLILGAFSLFIFETGKTKEVLAVYTPTKIGIDLNNNKNIEHNEIICIANEEGFSLSPSDEFYEKYSKHFNLNKTDMISLGYLAQDYAQKTLSNKQVSFNPNKKITSECQYGTVKLNGVNYKNLLYNSGFGIINNKIGDETKFKTSLQKARKLNLVILNHRSNKYHTLDCKYAKLAHDTVIIPEKQLPKDAKPCKFCHNFYKKYHKKFHYKKNFDIFVIPNIPQPALTHSFGNINLYYTNFTKHLKPTDSCTTNVCSEFVTLTNNAKSSIDMAIYGYENVGAITKALEKAKNRGVKIRFVYDENSNPNNTFYKSNYIIKNLTDKYQSDNTGSATQSNMIMHNKFIIFDNETVYTGSMNFSKSGLSGYDENDVAVIKSSDIAKLYELEFEQMLNGKFHKHKIKNDYPNRFQLGQSIVEVYFSPKDKSATRIVQLIQNSKHYVYIPTFLITHTQIANELIKADKRGVDVKIIMDANNVFTRNSKHEKLRLAGIPVKIENYAGKLHSKTMIIDDEYIIMGSMNFSNSGENRNDENMLVINNPALTKDYKIFFQYLWKMIPDKYLKFNPRAESKDSIGSCSDGVDNNFNGKIDKFDPSCK